MSDKQLNQAKIEALELMKKHVKKCWVPQISSDSDNIFKSKYFGKPWLSAQENWPVILDLPALFVLQLDIASLPQDIANLLGNTGLLQFFYQPSPEVEFDYSELSELSLVRIVNPEESANIMTQPKVDYEEDISHQIITHWTEIEDYPHPEDYDSLDIEEKLEEIAAKYDLYQDDIAQDVMQGDKLGGWPFWTQGNETPEDSVGDPMIAIYQLDAGCFFDGSNVPAYAPNLFAGDGTGHIFVSKNNPRELIFQWACG